MPDVVKFYILICACVLLVIALIGWLYSKPLPRRTVYRQPGEADEKYLQRIQDANDSRAMLAYLEERSALSDLPPTDIDNPTPPAV